MQELFQVSGVRLSNHNSGKEILRDRYNILFHITY